MTSTSARSRFISQLSLSDVQRRCLRRKLWGVRGGLCVKETGPMRSCEQVVGPDVCRKPAHENEETKSLEGEGNTPDYCICVSSRRIGE